MQCFQYTDREVEYLGKKDPILGAAMARIGHIEREVQPDLFTALVRSIVGQQISTKAALTVNLRLSDTLGGVTPGNILRTDAATIQSCGLSMRKVSYIRDLAETVRSGALDLDSLHSLSDEEVCIRLSALRGIGVWTAEMLMTFSMQRPDIMSWDDLAIHRGLRMLYRHRKITRELFSRYRKRYSPFASVACLYLWEIAGGALPDLTDPVPKSPARKPSAQKRPQP